MLNLLLLLLFVCTCAKNKKYISELEHSVIIVLHRACSWLVVGWYFYKTSYKPMLVAKECTIMLNVVMFHAIMYHCGWFPFQTAQSFSTDSKDIDRWNYIHI